MMFYTSTKRRRLAPLLVPLLVLASLVCHGALAGAHWGAQDDAPPPLVSESPVDAGGGPATDEHPAEYLPPISYGAVLLLILATAIFLQASGTFRRLRAGLTGAGRLLPAVPPKPPRASAAPLLQVFRL